MLSVSAPASTILFGEHAVLHGHPAIAVALNHRINATFVPNNTQTISIQSDLANHTTALSSIQPHPKLTFVCKALERHPPLTGGTLSIQSKINSTVGLGSSAAVTVAVLGCMTLAKQQPLARPVLLKQALDVIQAVQHNASGTDAAASLYGGCIWYEAGNSNVTPLLVKLPILSLHYCGYKTPTPQVIERVHQRWWHDRQNQQKLYQEMGQITTLAKSALLKNEPINTLMNDYHEQLMLLGVEDVALKKLRQTLFNDGALGVKISGSGLGDCLLSTRLNNPLNTSAGLPLTIDPKGLSIS